VSEVFYCVGVVPNNVVEAFYYVVEAFCHARGVFKLAGKVLSIFSDERKHIAAFSIMTAVC